VYLPLILLASLLVNQKQFPGKKPLQYKQEPFHAFKKPTKKGESLVKTKAYKAWSYIIYSALNPKSRDYIPNITIHEEWRDFHTFHKDVGDPLFKNMAFARVNKDKGFFPGNCFWLTKSEASKINGKFTGRKQKKF
jgi:hypothetical protein